jgi:SNF2 family DNA or RNA helicase
MFDVHIHHGPQKLKNVKDIKEKDVIITTYHTLNADCRIPESVEETDEIRWVQKHGGVLSRTSWHRFFVSPIMTDNSLTSSYSVVLDEAQFIRNRKTQSSRAVAMLDATYRWCLTGTPITNTLADVYGLIRFGKFRPWNDWREFDKQIVRTHHC